MFIYVLFIYDRYIFSFGSLGIIYKCQELTIRDQCKLCIRFRYSSIDEMWEIELNKKEPKTTVVNPVGSKESWYNNANSYWSVSR